MSSIYCPHLQDTFDEHGMVWLRDINLNVSLRGGQNLVLCKECLAIVQEQIFKDMSRMAGDTKMRIRYTKK